LGHEYQVARHKFRRLLSDQQRGDPLGRDWLDASFEDLAQEFLSDVQQRRPASTYADYRYCLPRALKHLGPTVRVGELRKFHWAKIEQALAAKGNSPTTVRKTLSAVELVLNWAVAMEFLTSSPLGRYRKPQARGRTRTLDKGERYRMRRSVSRPFRLVLWALLRTGARPGEVRAVTWDEMDWAAGQWRLAEHKTHTRQKHPEPRHIVLDDSMLRLCRLLAARQHSPSDHIFLNTRDKP
jgi:integrase